VTRIDALDLLLDNDSWRRSTYSGGTGNCLEVNFAVSGFAGIRDSKLGDASPVIVMTTTGFAGLKLAALKGSDVS
jgi:hypothetical protein